MSHFVMSLNALLTPFGLHSDAIQMSKIRNLKKWQKMVTS